MAIKSFAQNEQRVEENHPKFSNAGWLYSEVDKTYIEYETFDTLFSPFGEFEILNRRVGLSDNVVKSQYFLINNQLNDTAELLTILGHDGPSINFFWTNNNKLIFENSQDYRKNVRLQILNLKTNEIEFSTEGSIPIVRRLSHNFFDRKNNILIYYIPGSEKNNYYADLMELNLADLSIKKLMTFTTRFRYEYPIVTLDSKNRLIKMEYFDSNSRKNCSTELKY